MIRERKKWIVLVIEGKAEWADTRLFDFGIGA
jgi:hypothetical protein